MRKRICCSNSGLLLGLLLILPVAVNAQQSQSSTVDATAPIVLHETVADEVSAGTPLTISATVTDNVGVDSVTVFYRSRGESQYRRAAMERIGDTDIFVATLDTEAVREPALEYYIEAADAADNLLLVGYALSPLVVNVTASTLVATPAAKAESVLAPESESKTSPWIWVLLGVGAAALISGSSGGGGGGSSSSDVTISGPLPQNR